MQTSPYQAKSLLASIRFALQGIALGLRTQRNVRIHLLITIFVFACGFTLRLANWEWVATALCVGLMWLAELQNTAIEWLVDVYTQHTYHELGGKIKDIAAGACLVVAFMCIFVGCVVFLPHLYHLYLDLVALYGR